MSSILFIMQIHTGYVLLIYFIQCHKSTHSSVLVNPPCIHLRMSSCESQSQQELIAKKITTVALKRKATDVNGTGPRKHHVPHSLSVWRTNER